MKLRNKKEHPIAFVVDGVQHSAVAMGQVVPDVDPRKVECVLKRGLPIEEDKPEPVAAAAPVQAPAPKAEAAPEAKPEPVAEPPRDTRSQDNRGGQGRR